MESLLLVEDKNELRAMLRDLDPVTYYVYGRGWQGAPRWPPPGAVRRDFFLDCSGGRLRESPPALPSAPRP